LIPVVRDRHPLWDEHWHQERMRPEETPARDPEARADVAQMASWPTRWRGALVVTVTDGRPLAVVHMPRRSFAPFVMSFGFLVLFAALIVDHPTFMATGAGIIAVALVMWFWPQSTETAAMEEMRGGPHELPLAQAGPSSNGFWGTAVFVLIMATALTTIVAGYFYLGGNVAPHMVGSPAEPIERPAIALGLLALGLIPLVAAIRAIRRRRPGALRLGTTAALLLGVAHLWLLIDTWLESGLAPATDGQHSGFVGVAGFHAVLSVILLVMALVAVLWAWIRPADARGHAVAWNAGLVYAFTLVSGVIVFTVLYLVPRFGVGGA
jgi:heme/copper-type cytochrome/quinol oxidase subunit 3